MSNRGQPIELDSREELLQARLLGLRERFVSRLAQDRADIIRARKAGDNRTVRNIAHRLAGASASFGFPEIGEAAVRLEAAIDSGDDPGLARPAYDYLVATLENPGSHVE